LSELRFIDLSVPIQEPIEGELEGELAAGLAARIDYQEHDGEGAAAAAAVMGCAISDFPDEQGWASETVTLATHSGTHVDAPWHYFPTTAGKPAKTIDQLPLGEFFGDGVVLDLRGFGPGERVPAEAVAAAVEKTGQELSPGEIVLLRFDGDAAFGTPAYWTEYPGMSAAATEWLVERGIKVIGTDAVGFDRDFGSMSRDFAATTDASLLWEAHRVGIEHEYFQIEKLANLGALPTRGFKVACFPIKITGASAAWARVVGIVGL
jgi:kynurenine formamidase